MSTATSIEWTHSAVQCPGDEGGTTNQGDGCNQDLHDGILEAASRGITSAVRQQQRKRGQPESGPGNTKASFNVPT